MLTEQLKCSNAVEWARVQTAAPQPLKTPPTPNPPDHNLITPPLLPLPLPLVLLPTYQNMAWKCITPANRKPQNPMWCTA